VTARRRLVPDAELRRALDTLREYGVQIGAVDIRADGVTVYPANQNAGTAYDRWKAKDQSSDRPAHR